MTPHSSTLAWKIPWTEEDGGLQCMGSLRVRHDWATALSLFTFMHWRRKWQPRDGGAWWAAVYGVGQSRTRLKRLSSSSSCWALGKPLPTRDWSLLYTIRDGFLNYAPWSPVRGGELVGNPDTHAQFKYSRTSLIFFIEIGLWDFGCKEGLAVMRIFLFVSNVESWYVIDVLYNSMYFIKCI